MSKNEKLVTFETTILALYLIGMLMGIFTGIGKIHDAYFWGWSDAASGLFLIALPIVLVWNIAKKYYTNSTDNEYVYKEKQPQTMKKRIGAVIEGFVLFLFLDTLIFGPAVLLGGDGSLPALIWFSIIWHIFWLIVGREAILDRREVRKFIETATATPLPPSNGLIS